MNIIIGQTEARKGGSPATQGSPETCLSRQSSRLLRGLLILIGRGRRHTLAWFREDPHPLHEVEKAPYESASESIREKTMNGSTVALVFALPALALLGPTAYAADRRAPKTD